MSTEETEAEIRVSVKDSARLKTNTRVFGDLAELVGCVTRKPPKAGWTMY